MPATHFFKTGQPATRLIAQGLFWLFLVLALILKLGWIDVVGHDQEWFLSYMSLLSALGMVSPFLVAKIIPRFGKNLNERSLGLVEILAGLAMIASWVGAFGLYRAGIEYDTFVHFFATACLTLIFCLVLSRSLRLAARPWLLLTAAAGLALAGGLINELFEYYGDLIFDTMMYGEAGQPNDTLWDIIGNIMGALFGFLIFYFWQGRIKRHIE